MATNTDLQSILGWVAITKAVNAVKDGVPNPFPPYLFKVEPENQVIGDSVKYNAIYGQRKTARTIRYGSGPRDREMQQEELRQFKFLSFGEKRTFEPYVLQVLRDYDSLDNRQKGKQVIANNIKTFGTLFGNARIVAVATTFAYGFVYDDGNGNLLPSSSGAVNSYDHKVPSANIGTITDDASAGIFGATGLGSWALNSTNIPLQLTHLEETAAADHGYEPEVALYGKAVKTNMIQNDFVLDFLARNPTMQVEWLKDNTIPAGLFDYIWCPVWKASYTKDDGTKVLIWPQNGVTFLPAEADLNAWYAMSEGSNLIPSTIDIIPDAMSAMESLEVAHGAAGYARVSTEPVALYMVMVDTFWPGLKLAETVYIADTVS